MTISKSKFVSLLAFCATAMLLAGCGGAGTGSSGSSSFPSGVYTTEGYDGTDIHRFASISGTNHTKYPGPELSLSICVAFDSQGRMYVGDSGSIRIYSSPSGNNPQIFGAWGSGQNQFKQVAAIFIDSQDRIYVADPANGRIIRINNPQGDGWTALDISLSAGINVNQTSGLFVDANGRIYINVWTGRILRYDSLADTTPDSFGNAGSGMNQFNHPCDIHVDANGRIYVADTGNSRIVRIDDMNGTNWTTYGTPGYGIGKFNSPIAVTTDTAGHIYISDTANNRMVRLDDMTGAGWVTYGSSGVFPHGVADIVIH